MKYQCPCCGYATFDEEPNGNYDICPVCFWEDDPFQSQDPDDADGANKVSLNEARANFAKFGACEERFVGNVRAPHADEMLFETKWVSFEDGMTIGHAGSEGGTILEDEEVEGACRITLEKGGWAPYSITCGIYGMMVHTSFAGEEDEARKKYEGMKADLKSFIDSPSQDENGEWCEQFVNKW